MPELPEVETVRKGLSELIVGKTISQVDVLWARIIENPDAQTFSETLVGQTVEKIKRRGKYLIFQFSEVEMISHLRMEGKYEVHASDELLTKHVHVRFTFTDQTALWYLDVRKFGRMCLVAKGQALQYKGLQQLGPEPVAEQFLPEVFYQQLQRQKKAIKPLLLEQKIVAGLGNIYADEVLWQAQIHPETPANQITEAKSAALHQAILSTMANAITAGGTTIRSYQNALGATGAFQLSLQAYGQNGKPCARCGTIIQKCKVAQRGTHFCPHCQR